MEELQLSETEKRYFSDLFVCCDVENTGQVPQPKALELFRSGNITPDTLNQITDILQISGNVLNRVQFYSYLKLIAAHQAAHPLTEGVLTSGGEFPLPRFRWPELQTDESAADSDTIPIGSPSSTASDSPTPTNSVQERSWAVGNWSGLCEEQRQLLGTEEESSDRHSSEEDADVTSEVWTITAEQRDYYANQFKQLQPDVHGLLAGVVARKFFEKSMLPTVELRKIWQLSDVTRDGCLSLEEFNTAMHLVVLRRNHISLPAVLPVELHPTTSAPAQIKETWTKFQDSPTGSPGPKPVNFDFHKGAVEADPLILHPKPLRLTPEILQEDQPAEIKRPQPKQKFLNNLGAIPPPPPPLLIPEDVIQKDFIQKDFIQKETTALKKPPPPPPPRPIRSHGRSSSLDLNRLGKSAPLIPPRVSPNIITAPPPPQKKLVNQRSEGGGNGGGDSAFADFDRFDLSENYENICEPDGATTRRHGAFEIYRKPPVVTKKEESPPPTTTPEDVAKLEVYAKLKEQNLVLVRLCQELSQELADVREERTTLQLRIQKQQQSA